MRIIRLGPDSYPIAQGADEELNLVNEESEEEEFEAMGDILSSHYEELLTEAVKNIEICRVVSGQVTQYRPLNYELEADIDVIIRVYRKPKGA
jgi:hypothetical protein